MDRFSKKEYDAKRYQERKKEFMEKFRQYNYSEGNTCIDCGKLIINVSIRCYSCMGKMKVGENNPHWKGGITKDKYGRVYILVGKEHPMAQKNGYVLRSRLVMAEHLGRFLTLEEVVHHEKEIDNDKIETLILFATTGEHTKYHNKLRGE